MDELLAGKMHFYGKKWFARLSLIFESLRDKKVNNKDKKDND